MDRFIQSLFQTSFLKHGISVTRAEQPGKLIKRLRIYHTEHIAYPDSY